MKKLSLIFLFTALIVGGSLFGQSLYGSGISPESALVRVIFTSENDIRDIQIGNETYNGSKLYYPVAPGMYFFNVSGNFVEIVTKSGKYYTLIIDSDRCLVFEDEKHTAPAKNQIYLYNTLTDRKVSLLVSSSGDLLFENLEPGKSIQRAVNPLKVSFSVKDDAGESRELGSLPMSRGGSTSVIAYNGNSGLKVLVLKAEVKKEP